MRGTESPRTELRESRGVRRHAAGVPEGARARGGGGGVDAQLVPSHDSKRRMRRTLELAIHGLYWDNDDRFKPSTF